MNIKQPECWSVDPQTRGLRVELSSGQSVIMAYHHFISSELNMEGPEDTLKLNFVTRELVVRGKLLRRIEAAVLRMELASINVIPSQFRNLIGENQPIVSSIKMTVVDSKDVATTGR